MYVIFHVGLYDPLVQDGPSPWAVYDGHKWVTVSDDGQFVLVVGG